MSREVIPVKTGCLSGYGREIKTFIINVKSLILVPKINSV